jgi:excisionase family DNA binding protein
MSSGHSSGDILTTFQAAKLCGVSHKSIERWIDAGLLPGFRTPGGHRRVHRADLLGFVQSRRTMESGTRLTGPKDGEAPRVLIVDDDPSIRMLFQEFFRTAYGDKYSIEVAGSGYDAGVQVERFKPHVMLLDLMMPDLNGFQVCEKTRMDADHASMIIIAMTGSDAMASQARESNLFHGVFLKPIKMAQVKENIDELLAERGFALGAFVGARS